jgi:hypothetical protein
MPSYGTPDKVANDCEFVLHVTPVALAATAAAAAAAYEVGYFLCVHKTKDKREKSSLLLTLMSEQTVPPGDRGLT